MPIYRFRSIIVHGLSHIWIEPPNLSEISTLPGSKELDRRDEDTIGWEFRK